MASDHDHPSSPAVAPGNPIRAAEYVRMSTEHQQYSTQNQDSVIQRYAQAHGMSIIRTYEDAGKSGLRLQGREALKQLIHDVQSGSADYDAILVYDVSRWGRFQDADESAYYEYLCKRVKISVHYCAEQFTNDGTPVSTIIKSVKRAMAGEYSRELSAKVFAGQCRLIELGYHQGGNAGYGLRRRLQDQHATPKGALARGEHKSIQTDRVVLVPGPPEEIAAVQRIYRLFTDDLKSETEIAAILNGEGLRTDYGRDWNRGTIHEVLTNPKYRGDNVYNRISFKLKQQRINNPPEMWIIAEGAFAPVIDRELFARAQVIISSRQMHFSDDELLDRLRRLLQERGTLSAIIIDETPAMPSSSTYRTRFQSLYRAYTLVGYCPSRRDYEYVEINRRLRDHYRAVIDNLVRDIRTVSARVTHDEATGLLHINDEFTTALILSRCHHTKAGSHRWTINLDATKMPDITIATRMAPSNDAALDYYLLPSSDLTIPRLRLAEENGITLDVYRFDNLEYFLNLV
jgi:DNA invertase Pin-like site-specific DNA recombinase